MRFASTSLCTGTPFRLKETNPISLKLLTGGVSWEADKLAVYKHDRGIELQPSGQNGTRAASSGFQVCCPNYWAILPPKYWKVYKNASFIKLLRWRKSHLSYLSHFRTWNRSLYERKKLCLLFLNISFRSRGIQVFKICKLSKWWRHKFSRILIKYDEQIHNSQFISERFEF